MPIKKKTTMRHSVEVGTGIAAGIAGALAGGYLLYKRTKPQQKQAKAWVLKARKEAAVEAKKAKLIGEKEYHRIVEKAIRHYGAIEKVGAPEIASVIRDAKAEWKHIEAEAKKAAKSAPVTKKTVKRPAKKAAKKTVKKVVRK